MPSTPDIMEVPTEIASFGMSWFWFPEAQFGTTLIYAVQNAIFFPFLTKKYARLCPRCNPHTCRILRRHKNKPNLQESVSKMVIKIKFLSWMDKQFYLVQSGDHTETTEVVYDPTKTNYSNLLSMFWKNHDATQKCTRQVFLKYFWIQF